MAVRHYVACYPNGLLWYQTSEEDRIPPTLKVTRFERRELLEPALFDQQVLLEEALNRDMTIMMECVLTLFSVELNDYGQIAQNSWQSVGVWFRSGLQPGVFTPEFPLTPDHVRVGVKYVEAEIGDSEVAPILVDNVYRAVLEAIATDSCSSPIVCVQEAWKLDKLRFNHRST